MSTAKPARDAAPAYPPARSGRSPSSCTRETDMPPKSRSETEKRTPRDGELHIASLLVHFQPLMREAVRTAILAMEGTEIHLAEESKLVVTVEGPHEGFIADRMTA